jgi:DNA-binding NarL/FixJ family response regulator
VRKEGYEIIKMLKAAWPHLKIVIYSMHAGPVEGKTQVSGADMVITNHSSLAEFKYVLDQLLKQQRAWQSEALPLRLHVASPLRTRLFG